MSPLSQGDIGTTAFFPVFFLFSLLAKRCVSNRGVQSETENCAGRISLQIGRTRVRESESESEKLSAWNIWKCDRSDRGWRACFVDPCILGATCLILFLRGSQLLRWKKSGVSIKQRGLTGNPCVILAVECLPGATQRVTLLQLELSSGSLHGVLLNIHILLSLAVEVKFAFSYFFLHVWISCLSHSRSPTS